MEPGVELDKAIFWKKARKRKNGQEVEQCDEDLEIVCKKIVSLLSYDYTVILVGHRLLLIIFQSLVFGFLIIFIC